LYSFFFQNSPAVFHHRVQGFVKGLCQCTLYLLDKTLRKLSVKAHKHKEGEMYNSVLPGEFTDFQQICGYKLEEAVGGKGSLDRTAIPRYRVP
jgi:hypothetical protein